MKHYDLTNILALSHLRFHLFMIKSKSSPVVSASPFLRRPANRRVSEMKPSPAPGLRQSPSLHRWSLITPPDDLCHPVVLPATQNNRGFVLPRMPGQGDEHISCSCPLQTTWNKNMTDDCDQGYEIRPGGHAHNGLHPSIWPRWWSALCQLSFSLSLSLYRWSVRRSSARGSLPRCWGIKRGAPFRWNSSKRCRIVQWQREERTRSTPGT